MKNRSCFSFQRLNRIGLGQNRGGQTLVEVMIAFTVFTILATCIASTLLQTKRMTESDIAQAEAQTVAQGILEQVQLIPYDTLALPQGSSPGVALKFVGLTSSGVVQIQDFSLLWEPIVTPPTVPNYTRVGEVQGGTQQGVLLDVDYKNTATNLVRNRRHMDVRVNLTKTVDTTAGDVAIVLNYQYPVPDRKGPGAAPIFVTQQLRTVRSQAASY